MIRFDRATVVRAGMVVVEEVSLEVPSGTCLALIGATAAGKSSLLAAAAGAIPLHAGDVVVAGRSVRREPDAVRRLVGYVPDRLPAWEGLRAGEFLDLSARDAGLSGAGRRTAVARGLDLAGLGGRGRLPLDALAAGHAKRLLLARALLHDPAVLLLDDPCAGLDPAERATLERLLADLQLMGRTVVAALDDARLPDGVTHVALLAEARLVRAGVADPAVLAPGRRWRWRIDCRGQAAAAARVLAGHGAEVDVVDGDTLDCRFEAARGDCGELVEALVRGGIRVGAAGFHPPWTAQLLRSE